MIDLSELQAEDADATRRYPVERWHPEFCGEMDVFIDKSGTWYHQGQRIARIALVKLYEKILWRHQARWVLRTPHEEVAIEVADQPFMVYSVLPKSDHYVFIVGHNQWPLKLNDTQSLVVESDGRLGYCFDGCLKARLSRQASYDLLSEATADEAYLSWPCLQGQLRLSAPINGV